MVVGGGDDWAAAGQMRRLSDGRASAWRLRRAGKHANAAVGPGVHGPLDSVVAVGVALKGYHSSELNGRE
jgi:hypothetical protein